MTAKAPRGTLPNWDLWPEGSGLLPVPALDPGEGTGLALLLVPEASIYGSAPPDVTVVWNEEITGPEKEQAKRIVTFAADVGLHFGSYAKDGRPFPVVIEDFSLRMFTRDPSLLSPVRITAMIDVLLDQMTVPAQLFRQQVADPQKIYSDEMLKDLGLYATGQKNARIAMKQALYFLRRARKDKALRELAWGKR